MNGYTDPHDATSPRNRLRRHTPIFDDGRGSYSLALLDWDDGEYVGIRWNGNLDDEPAGNPNSRGNPTWFVLPPEVGRAVLSWALETGRVDGGRIEAGRAEPLMRNFLKSSGTENVVLSDDEQLKEKIREVVLEMRDAGEL